MPSSASALARQIVPEHAAKVIDGFGGLIGFPTTFIVDKDWRVYKKYLGMTRNKKDMIEKDLQKLIAEGP